MSAAALSLGQKIMEKITIIVRIMKQMLMKQREAYEASLPWRQAHLVAESALAADSTKEITDSALVLWGYLGHSLKVPPGFLAPVNGMGCEQLILPSVP